MEDADTLYQRAFAAYRAGQPTDAEARLGDLLARAPGDARALLLKSVVHDKAEPAVCLSLVEQAVHLDPFGAEGWYNLAVFEAERGRLAAALVGYRRTVLLDPFHVNALGNGCELLRRFDHFDEALAWADRQIVLGRESWAAHLNRAVCLLHLRRMDEAEAAFKTALAIDPARPIVRWEMFPLYLHQRRFGQAWESFEERFACGHLNGVHAYPFEAPPWRGEDLAGRHIVIHNEQGLGDQIMFAAALAEVIAVAGRVSIVVSPELEGLFKASFPTARLFAARVGRFAGDHPPPSWLGELGEPDFQLPIGGLMHRLRSGAGAFAGAGPYLAPSPAARARWKSLVAAKAPRRKGLRVGLCWASNPALFRLDSSRRAAKKSMALEVMAPLAKVKGVQLISVLNWPIDPMPPAFKGKLLDLSAELRSLDDTAALIESLDLVITVDTAAAHLAGALGAPVWLLLHDFADCRWGLTGEDSYWYPSMRLFRQAAPGDWAEVIGRVKAQLGDVAAAA
ncbi:MAG TPA: tetratricopeptide repeat protein [Caulobacteraceae bacterium]